MIHVHDEPVGGVGPPSPHSPDPAAFPTTIDLDDGPSNRDVELFSRPELNTLGDKGIEKQVRDERLAFFVAMGRGPTWIAKKMGVSRVTVTKWLKDPEIAQLAIVHRRQMAEACKKRVLTAFRKAADLIPEHMELDTDGLDEKAEMSFYRKKRHELDALKFVWESGLGFLQSDHALTKHEEDLFGAKAHSSAPVVQVNQINAEQPSKTARIVAATLAAVPREAQRQVAAKLREQKLIDDEPIDAEIVEKS